jgi:hypothetical protein
MTDGLSSKRRVNLPQYAFIGFWIALFILPAAANDVECPPGVQPASDGPLSYQPRGDRCEGLFAQRVSTTGLRIAAFHQHPARYDETYTALDIYSGEAASPKTLTVTSLRPRQFYRMDTIFDGDNYSLPLDLVTHPEVDVSPSDFAAVVCSENCRSSVPTLIPAAFDGITEFNPYIVLVASVDLFEIRIRIVRTEDGEVLFDQEMLGERTWPAGRPANFPLAPYLDNFDRVLFEVIATGRGNRVIDAVAVQLDRG